MKTLLDVAKTSLLCRHQLYFSSMNVRVLTGNDEDLLVDRPVASQPSSEYVGLGLTWLDTEISADAHLKSWGVLGWYKCIGYDASDKAVGIEAEVEVDVWKLRFAMAWRPDCTW